MVQVRVKAAHLCPIVGGGGLWRASGARMAVFRRGMDPFHPEKGRSRKAEHSSIALPRAPHALSCSETLLKVAPMPAAGSAALQGLLWAPWEEVGACKCTSILRHFEIYYDKKHKVRRFRWDARTKEKGSVEQMIFSYILHGLVLNLKVDIL